MPGGALIDLLRLGREATPDRQYGAASPFPIPR
jgi:hypothetical protein